MHVTAAILAGGRAARFDGRDKSALVVEGRSILDRQLDELSRLTHDILIVGGRATADRARTIEDIVPGCGPLGGLHAALTESAGEPTVVVAGDMPFISAALLESLAALTKDADAVVPHTERGYHPLCAAYTRACLGPIARRLANGQLKLIDLLADVRTRIVAPEELDGFGDRHRLMANINTPAEYDAVLHGHERQS
jgi:molybdopterin-guanine dinucleotide biosynthesis protein A